jgi:hypothetical protein
MANPAIGAFFFAIAGHHPQAKAQAPDKHSHDGAAGPDPAEHGGNTANHMQR